MLATYLIAPDGQAWMVSRWDDAADVELQVAERAIPDRLVFYDFYAGRAVRYDATFDQEGRLTRVVRVS